MYTYLIFFIPHSIKVATESRSRKSGQKLHMGRSCTFSSKCAWRVFDFAADFFFTKVHIQNSFCNVTPSSCWNFFQTPILTSYRPFFKKILEGWNFNKKKSVRSHFFRLPSSLLFFYFYNFYNTTFYFVINPWKKNESAPLFRVKRWPRSSVE